MCIYLVIYMNSKCQLLTLLLVSSVALLLPAQPERTELSVLYGISNYQGDLVDSDFFVLGESNFAFSARVGMPIAQGWVIRAGGSVMQLSGSDMNFPQWRDKPILMQFNTRVYEMSARVEWFPFGPRTLRVLTEEELAMDQKKILAPGRYLSDGTRIDDEIDGFWVSNQEQGVRVLYDKRGSRWVFDASGRQVSFTYREVFQPFLFGGAAWSRFNAQTKARTQTGEPVSVEPQEEREKVVFPFGAGLRYEFHPNWSIQGEAGWRFTGTDYLDGFSQMRNPEANDWYFFAGIGVNFQLGAPYQPKLQPADSDKDGLPDLVDECPFNAGPPALQGCPDTDGDGVSDRKDRCPDQPGTILDQGCPPTDTDGDGLVDGADRCPEQAGIERLQGCPETDQDEDGVPDDLDECPMVKGDPVLRGCPDADGDGIPDYRDECPGEYGLPDYKGCPTSGDGQLTQLLNGIPAVRFAEESTELGPAGRTVLNRVVSFLQQYPQYKLRIIGHADEFDTEAKNQELATQRARVCRQYLATRGISDQRLLVLSKGSTDPVTPIDQASNRLNRRVAFQLFR